MNLRTVSAVCFLALMASCTHLPEKIEWRLSEEDEPWQEPVILKTVPAKQIMDPDIQINPNKTYQVIDGWGGSFNEQGYAALLVLDKEVRLQVMHNIFDPVEGLKFNICRTPIAASDFAVDNIVNLEGRYDHLDYPPVFGKYYSYNDHEGDFGMEQFSVERDTAFLIPYIKMALEIRPDLKIWASPWTPPQWMKTDFHEDRCVDGECYAGYFRGYYGEADPAYSRAYALYFARYLEEYKKHGIHIYALHIQNEFSLKQYWTSCVWTGSDLADFYANYLIPLVRQSEIPVVRDVEIWHGTIHPKTTDPEEFGKEIRPAFKLNAGKITGAGFQWKGVNFIEKTKEEFPDIKLMATETRCGDGSNDWEYAEQTWGDMYSYLGKGVNSYMQWNMILDQVGKSSYWVGFKEDFWAQSSMFTIDVEKKEVIYNPQFYAVKHFSYYIIPGARRIETANTHDKVSVIGFRNPDESIVLELWNGSDEYETVSLILEGWGASAELPPHSFSTIIY